MTPSSHIFVTGGNGFVGSYILRTLLKKGYQHITAIRRPNSRMGLVKHIAHQINWIEADLFDYEILVDTLKNADVIMHSAAIISFLKSEEKEMHKVNVQGTANLLNAALEAKIDQFLHVSSIAALGRTPGESRISESATFQNSPLDSGYGLTKHLAEMEVWRAGSEGLDVTMINPAMIMGAGYWDNGTSKLVDTVYRHLKYYPVGSTGFVDVRDVAEMSIQMLEENHMNMRLVCCGETMKIQQMIELICREFDKKPPSIALSPLLRGLAWRAEWLRSKLTGSKQLITKTTLNSSAQDFEFDATKSTNELNFAYRPLAATMRETCQSYLTSQQANETFGMLSV